jgi:DNA polymerase-3 subunit chi
MTEIRFYHLQKQSLDRVLPQILEKAFGFNHRVVVRMENEKEVDRMNGLLWTYKPDAFLPHGAKKDGQAERQPIWLTDKDENPNKAGTLVLTQGTMSENIADYDLCCEMLDGRDDNAVKSARQRWKEYQDKGYDVTYWFQEDDGKWVKKS